MTATVIYRFLIAIRACWLIIEWLFSWGAHSRLSSFSLLHPYASLVADGIAVGFSLAILLGMFFFQRWARFIFVLLIAIALITAPFRMHYYSLPWPPSFVRAIEAFILLLTGAVIGMSFMPPVRDCFATQKA
jgi:hypothetical protein